MKTKTPIFIIIKIIVLHLLMLLCEFLSYQLITGSNKLEIVLDKLAEAIIKD